MRTRSGKRGFTLIEFTLAIVVLSILILASGGVLVFLARGQQESERDNTAQNRVELVRELMVADYRAGTSIVSPSTTGGNGAISGGFQVQCDTVEYNATTQVSTNVRVRWTWLSATQTITRYRAVETTPGSGTYGSETTTFSESNISGFTVLRYDDGTGIASDDHRLDFTLTTTQGDQGAVISYSVILRNIA